MTRYLAAVALAIAGLAALVTEAAQVRGKTTVLREAFSLLSFEPKMLARRDNLLVVNGQRGESSIASLHNGATIVKAGRVGHGLQLDGDKSFLAVYGLRQSADPVSEFSIAMWVNSQQGNSARFLFDLRDPKGAEPSLIRFFAYKDGIRFGAAGVEVDSQVNVHDRRWRHLAATWKTNVRRLYINGEVVAEKTGDFSALTPAQLMDSRPRVGAQSTGSRGPAPRREKRTFQGVLDEILISRKALEPGDVKALYEQGLKKRPLLLTR